MTSQSALECLWRSPIDCEHSSAAWRYPCTADHWRAYCQGGITATVSSAELPEHCLRTLLCDSTLQYVSTAYMVPLVSCAWVRGGLDFCVSNSVSLSTPALFISQDKDRLHYYRFSVRFLSWTFDERTSQTFLEGLCPDHFSVNYLTNSIPWNLYHGFKFFLFVCWEC